MALDRQSIEKRDFPIGRRGYEPVAVDEHLAAIAREVEALQRAKAAEPAPAAAAPAAPTARGAADSLATFASAQVQAIVEAAEASAAAIESEARDQAAQTAKEAAADARRTRDDAVARSQDHVGKVHEATSVMLERVDAMEVELGGVLESLRAGANQLNGELTLLAGNMDELYDAAGRAAAGRHHRRRSSRMSRSSRRSPSRWSRLDDDGDGDEEPVDPSDVDAARLVALNMALNGQTREQTDRYLKANFELSDRDALLEEVYESVEG